MCDGGFTDPSERKAGDRDPQLGGRDVGVEVGKQVEHAGRTFVALGDTLLDAGATDSDEGELGCHEKAVCQHEQNDGNES
jgi:hypothetical protein